MAPFPTLFLLSLINCYVFLRGISASTNEYYTAAVYEHSRIGVRNDPAEEVVQKNLAMYRKAAKAAKSKGADIIVFPEYGIFFPGKRHQLKPFLERIPDPKLISANPCEEFDAYGQSYILQSLSCMAKSNSIYIVANMGDIQDCKGEHYCPSDGVFHYNTNVVFNRNGTLILKYYKEHLFFEVGMDLPIEKQEPIFETEFGRFATYICFDIAFYRMTQVAQLPSVDGIVYTSMWVDFPPLFTSISFWQAWALGNNATLIASNIQIPGYFAVGSGIFHARKGALGYSFNPDGKSKLIISKVPKRNRPTVPGKTSVLVVTKEQTYRLTNDGKDVPLECSKELLGEADDIHKDYRCWEQDVSNYTFVKLKNPSDHLEACNNGMCCELDYTTKSLSENFYLGVFNGTRSVLDRYHWCEEDCFLVRCEAIGDKPCATFPMKSKTIFHHIRIQANFTTQYAYPHVLSSSMRLVPKNEWQFEVTKSSPHEAVINFKSQMGKNVILAGFHGHCYDKDPPYIR